MEKQNSSISSFKRFIVKILAPFLIIVGVAGWIFNYFFEQQIILKSQISGAYKVNRIISETHPNEIPIFGSSRAIMGLIPDSLGNDHFNYGINGAYFNVTLFFLEEECKKKKARPQIIINLDPFGLRNGIGDISSYLYNAGNPEIKELLDTVYKPYFGIPVLKYYGYYENYYRIYLTNRIGSDKVANNGAMYERNTMPKKDFDKMVAERNDAMPLYEMNDVLKNKLFSIISGHPERYFIFVISPYHSSCRMADSLDKLNEDLCRQLVSYKNVKLFDCGKLPLTDDMFFNPSHLSYKGAIVFTKAFKDSLNSIGIR